MQNKWCSMCNISVNLHVIVKKNGGPSEIEGSVNIKESYFKLQWNVSVPKYGHLVFSKIPCFNSSDPRRCNAFHQERRLLAVCSDCVLHLVTSLKSYHTLMVRCQRNLSCTAGDSGPKPVVLRVVLVKTHWVLNHFDSGHFGFERMCSWRVRGWRLSNGALDCCAMTQRNRGEWHLRDLFSRIYSSNVNRLWPD